MRIRDISSVTALAVAPCKDEKRFEEKRLELTPLPAAATPFHGLHGRVL